MRASNSLLLTAPTFWMSLVSIASAQEFYISQPSVTTCQGALLDSGGNAGAYGNNENFTTVICPDGGGPAISLQWVIFNLSTAGVAPVDQMSIYDGDNTSAPLIGNWSGSDSPGIIGASFANPTGCLTVVFTSNNTGTGDFAANISCFEPSDPTVITTLGITLPRLSIFPNPGRDLFTVAYSGSSPRYTVIDLTGQEVMDLGLRTGRFTMDLSSLASGTYLLRWSDGEQSGRLPVVLQR